jgi:ATP-binding cassette, subfamily C (CFTR/MRP), member 1
MLGPLAAAVFPRLSQTFFRYMQPLLIRRVTLFIDQPDTESAMNQGWGLTAAYGLVYIGIAVSTNIEERLQVY